MQRVFFPTPRVWEESRISRDHSKSGGEKTRGCLCGLIASTETFNIEQITRDRGTGLLVMESLDETQSRFSMPVSTGHIMCWTWSCLSVGPVAAVLVKDGRCHSLHLIFLFFLLLSALHSGSSSLKICLGRPIT